MRKYKLVNQLTKYTITGVVSNIIEFLLIYLLTDCVQIWYIYSNVMASTTALTLSFFVNNYWTYGKKKIELRSIISLLLVHLANIVIDSLLLYVFTSVFLFYYLLSKVFVVGFSYIRNFFISKYFIYK